MEGEAFFTGKGKYLKKRLEEAGFKVVDLPTGDLYAIFNEVDWKREEYGSDWPSFSEVYCKPNPLHPDNLSASQQDHYLAFLESTLN